VSDIQPTSRHSVRPQPDSTDSLRVIIAGSRSLTDYEFVDAAMEQFGRLCGRPLRQVVSGGARGVDALGEAWAKDRAIPVKVFPADWNKHGKAAGPIRNQEMADYANALVAVWDGKSRGTKDMIDRACKCGLLVYVYLLDSAQGGGE